MDKKWVIEGARKLLSIDLEDDLPAELPKATKTQLGLAQQGAMRHLIKTLPKFRTDDEIYRYELIVKEMSRRGFYKFAGCLSDFSENELDKVVDELSLHFKK